MNKSVIISMKVRGKLKKMNWSVSSFAGEGRCYVFDLAEKEHR